MKISDPARRRFLLAVFVVSGFTGLIYESIWSHYLKLFLGHAAYAQSLVLAIFMGGMALGSWAIARYSTRIRHLLWGYVFVEGLIGALGIVFHRVFVSASDFSFAAVIPALPTGILIQAYKWSLAALLILPQSMLLGMTFPLISAGLIRRWPDRPGETLATLYFTNSLGAGLGVLVSGFVLIRAVGLPGTVLAAGLLNVVLALAVWSIVRSQAEPSPAPPSAAASAGATDPLVRWIAAAALLTGAASFMYELGWIRMLSMVLGSSTHSFEIMLSAFILGLAFGGLYVRRRIERIADLASYTGCVMVIMGVFAALTLVAYNSTFEFMAWALGTFTRTDSGYVAFNIISQTIAALIMIPATFCAGMTLPLLTHALLRRGTGERAIGAIYALNTLGAIVGVLLTIHVLMPLVGVKGVILLGAGVHIALGLSRLAAVRRDRPRTLAVAAAVGVAVLAFAAVAVSLDPLRMASGVYRTGFSTLPVGATVTYLRDGKTATISLAEQDGMVAIATNGKPDATIRMGKGEASRDELTMILAAALPLSMHPDAQRIANIGFGSGLTTHALLASGPLRQLDSIEIEPLMVEAARSGFGARIDNVFTDPRSHIVYEDAKTFFATTREPYDLIVSEPSNPWVSGVATLFSEEFYGRVAHYLRPDGYLVQWVQIYETDVDIIASIVKAMAPHFGAYAVYNSDDANVLIVATRATALGALSGRIFEWPQMRAELERIGVQSLADIQSRKIGDNRTIGAVLQAMPSPANSDFFPFVDLNAPRLRYMQRTAIELADLTVVPVPFLELLSGEVPGASTTPPLASSPIARDGFVRRALAIGGAVSSGALGGLDQSSASQLLLIETGRARCADPAAQAAWKGAARQLSDATAAYLRPGELRELWAMIMASPCYRDAAGEHKTWADLLAAVARRDAATIVKLGRQLLEPASASSPEELGYLTMVTAAAYMHLGQAADASALLDREWRRFGHASAYEFPLLNLLVLSRLASARGATPGP